MLAPFTGLLMYRLAYRNFGEHESLVVNHTVDAGGGIAGIRWYEIRDPGSAAPTVYQQGTFSPDSEYRWMGSIAMDHAGDIALGYSISSSSVYPSIGYTGRVASDPLGTLEAEATLISGAGSDTASSFCRWGDYTSMSIDPVDDCAFWYANEYLTQTGPPPVHTRIASFKFPTCTTSATVVIGGCDSGVPNVLLTGGGTITDSILQCASGAKNHGAFLSCVSQVTDDLKKAGIITGAQKGAIERCAGKAHAP